MSIQRESITQYHGRLRGHCPMGVTRWRAIKGLVYVAIMAVVALAGLIENGPFIAISFILAASLVFGIEIKEIQIADYLSIQFKGQLEAEGFAHDPEGSDDD